MAKSNKKTNLKKSVKEGKTSIVEIMTLNTEGSMAYEITDPSERLIATIGTSTNEPKFYPTDPGAQARGYRYSLEDFDDQAKLVVNTAFEIIDSETPEDLVKIAHWARKELKMRTMPQVLLAIAASREETKGLVKEYTTKVVNRADELKQVFTAYRSLFGSDTPLPNQLKHGLAEAFTKFKEHDFLKYEGRGRPHFADILKMIHRKKGYPLNKSLDHYLKTGQILDPKEIPVIAARKEFTKLTSFDEEAKSLAKKARVSWEVMVSQFGGSKEVWEYLIENEALGYMATMRNLRNMLKAEVSSKHLNMVAKKLVAGAVDSKQLPFRFLMAKEILDKEFPPNDSKVQKLTTALSKAASAVAANGHAIPGSTLSATDTSGSMESNISSKSQMTAVGAAAMLAGLLHVNSEQGSVCGIFADSFCPLKGVDNLGPLEIAKEIKNSIGHVGHGTNMEDVFRWAIRNNKKFDRIVVFSDMQTYGDIYLNQSTSTLWDKYKKQVNPNAKLHSIDLAGYGNSTTKQGDTSVNLVNGYSEKLLDTILRFEGIDSKTGEKNEEKEIFTLDYIRQNY